MLKTIEVTIDAKGQIHPLEALPVPFARRGLLTILPPVAEETASGGVESAFGFLKAGHSVTLEEMKSTVRKRGARR